MSDVPNAAVHVITDPAAIAKASTPDELSIYVGSGLVVASPNADALARVATAQASAFTSSPFHARLADEYAAGVGFLLAADLQSIFGTAASKAEASKQAAMSRLGVTDMRYFVVKQAADGSSGPRAVLTFDGERRGIASWLAAPGPVGALDYISADANIVAAFAVRDPAALVDDLLSVVGASDPQALESLRAFESQNGVSLRDDFAASLGGEFAFAVDGPLLPTPSWKVVLEVNDPARLQAAFEHSVDAINRQLAATGKPGLTLATSESDGRASYTLTSGATSAKCTTRIRTGTSSRARARPSWIARSGIASRATRSFLPDSRRRFRRTGRRASRRCSTTISRRCSPTFLEISEWDAISRRRSRTHTPATIGSSSV